ncbi:MFS transporter [Kitasatospora sp. HPMI-4]|uniref:MFS transporter n=1 Tax=Kitasatospora sp. HPMI-4 TaxID=3448443 RepID=UPI003F1DF7BD
MATETKPVPESKPTFRDRLSVLSEHDFRWFFAGYTISLFGSSMAPVAVAFAVLDSGGGGSELGWVMAARILPIVLVLLAGGVIADRLGSKRVMLAADLLRLGTQAVFAAVLMAGHPPVWAMVALVGVWGVGEGFFLPGLGALVPELVRRERGLADANTLLGLAGSVSKVAGPAAAGLLTAVQGPASVLIVDAVTYGVGALALARLSLPMRRAVAPGERRESVLADLGQGWAEFRSRTWLWTSTVQMSLFNLLVWAPFLILGPLTAQQRLGGARAWGLIMACYGAGAVLGGLAMLGRRPRRPLAVAMLFGIGWALPSAALAARLPLTVTAFAALLAGCFSSVVSTLFTTTTQQNVPPGVRARISSIETLGAFGLGPVGLALAGPVAARVGASAVLGFGAGWQVVTAVGCLAIPSVRNLRGGSRPR